MEISAFSWVSFSLAKRNPRFLSCSSCLFLPLWTLPSHFLDAGNILCGSQKMSWFLAFGYWAAFEKQAGKTMVEVTLAHLCCWHHFLPSGGAAAATCSNNHDGDNNNSAIKIGVHCSRSRLAKVAEQQRCSPEGAASAIIQQRHWWGRSLCCYPP